MGAFILAVLFGYLWLVHRRASLGWWTAAWALWFVRLPYGLAAGGMAVGGGDAVPRIRAMAWMTFVLLRAE